MNVNGSRFHLLLGAADWGRCLVRLEDRWQRLDATWSSPSPPASPPQIEAAPLIVDAHRQELRLRGQLIELGATPGEAPFTLASRRAAAADRHGNIYWIDADPRRLRVWSVGSNRESAFWPDGAVGATAAPRGDFAALTGAAPEERTYSALAVTDDHYLVVAFTAAGGPGLSAFDLMAGGAPRDILWPSGVDFAAFDMAPRRGGGLWVLDRVHARLWELDRRLAVVSRAQAPTTLAAAGVDVFQPADGPPRQTPEVTFPGGIDLGALIGPLDPIAVDVLPDGAVVVLDRNEAAQSSRVVRLRRRGDAIEIDVPVPLNVLAHDIVVSTAARFDGGGSGTAPVQLFVATASGNQAVAFLPGDASRPFTVHGSVDLFPLRRFGGRALLDVRGGAAYDSGAAAVRWVPVVQQPRARYADRAELVTPVFDAVEPQCVWDRVMLDACIPAGARVEVSCRAGDERARLDASPGKASDEWEVIGTWQTQPAPYLRGAGPELPWLGAAAARRTRRESGTGTWELLLQGMRGRYLQLRLRLLGNGTATPWIRALRVWAPRFSYPQRFLPGVYREDAAAGDFLERLLANPEGINSEIEGRIARVEALFDPRCAPAETLPWLAEWFDVALDPSWAEWRRRLFIAHAMDFFRWRGTAHGMRLALALAFAPCIDEAMFAEPGAGDDRTSGIRIVEAYLTRRIGAPAAGDPEGAVQGVIARATSAQWTPQEGNAGLVERYAAAQGRQPTPAELVAPFALVAPDDATDAAAWRVFAERQLGVVPGAGAEERALWRRFLQARYATRDELTARGLTAESIAAAELPADWPSAPAAEEDWRAFCALPGEARRRWQDFLGRRYRRIDRLNAAHQTSWPAFELIAVPDRLPATGAAQTDWLQFERQLLAIVRSAHRFSVLLPVSGVSEDPFEMDRRLQLAQRIVELEKPAHTVFGVRFYWALNRVGEARLGVDTLLDVGSRAPQLLPDAILGRAYVGASFVGGPPPPADGDRHLLAC